MSDFDTADGEGKTARSGATAASPPAFGPDDGLTAKQGRAVEALLREPNATRAAAAAGVNERTLRRWIKEPVFRSVVLRARRESYGQAIGLTQRYAPVAVATLVKVMNDPAAAASAKVTAAAVLLKLGREGVEMDDLIERVEQLEEASRPAKAIASRTVGATPDGDDEEEA